MNIWADNLFKEKNISVKPHEPPAELETSGPFRLSRHPMYLGMVLVLLGAAVLLGSLVTFIFPIAFVIAMNLMFIPLEEKNAEEIFGEKYLGYKRKVRRWV